MKVYLVLSILFALILETAIGVDTAGTEKDAAKEQKEVVETRRSKPTNVTLHKDFDQGTVLTYEYATVLEEYDDGTSANFLEAKVNLQDLNVWGLGELDKKSNVIKGQIRITVGWRNPQEDGYDLTGIEIQYNKDKDELKFDCVDGYGTGNLNTYNFDLKTGRDLYGRHNITIASWTNFHGPDPLGIQYRVPELNDCKIVTATATERPDFGENATPLIQPNKVV